MSDAIHDMPFQQPIVDAKTGLMDATWQRWFADLSLQINYSLRLLEDRNASSQTYQRPMPCLALQTYTQTQRDSFDGVVEDGVLIINSTSGTVQRYESATSSWINV